MKLPRSKAIRLHCLDCSAGSSHEVKNCVIKRCPLYPYRFGRNPTAEEVAGYTGPGEPTINIKKELTEVEKKKVRDKLAKARSCISV